MTKKFVIIAGIIALAAAAAGAVACFLIKKTHLADGDMDDIFFDCSDDEI